MRDVPDPRCVRKKKHDHAEVLTYVIIGMLAGRVSLRRILKWARNHEEWLRGFMPLENGIASAATVSRLLSSIDEASFLEVFVEWVSELVDTTGTHVAIDGKALRGAAEKSAGGKAPFILNMVDVATQLVLAQIPIGEKENEVTGIPKILEMFCIEGSVVTVDAIGSCKGVMGAALEKGAHFLVPVKKNMPQTYEQVGDYFEGELWKEDVDGGEFRCGSFSQCEKNRGRMEYRDVMVSGNTSVTDYINEVPQIRTIGYCRQIRIPIRHDADGNDITPGKEAFLKLSGAPGDGMADSYQAVGLLSDMELSAEDAAIIKRNHWRIENGLHHVLDDAFREDRSTATKSRNNLALVRKFAYNILRIAIIRGYGKNTMCEMMDGFADCPGLIEQYIFRGIEAFY